MSSKIEFDLSTLNRRDVILIIISASLIIGVIVGLVIFLSSGPRRGPKVVTTPTLIPTPTLMTALLTPSPSEPPTVEATTGPTPTLEPYQYQVKKGETLGYIIQVCCGYRDFSIIPAILALNNMPNENVLKEGQILLIPRQTPTPGPSATPTLLGTAPGPTQDYSGCSPEKRCTSPDGQYWIHEVRPGDTILSIAVAYNSRKVDIFRANGLSDNSLIVPGQKLNIPILVTLTPTLTPTGGPDSTATPTPTYSPPSLLAPANNASIPRGQPVILQWVTVHPLDPPQNYLVLVRNLGTGDEFRALTRGNVYVLPDSLKPGIGQTTRYEWQILVIAGTDPNSAPISGQDVKWAFNWGP